MVRVLRKKQNLKKSVLKRKAMGRQKLRPNIFCLLQIEPIDAILTPNGGVGTDKNLLSGIVKIDEH